MKFRPLARPIVLLVVLLPGLTACSTAHTARPLGKGKHAVHVSVGGPIAGLDSEPKKFIPLTTVTYKYGVTERADVFVGWHVLETFVNQGNFFFDLGASYYFLDQAGPRPGLSGALTISPLINRKSGWASLDLQVTASWFLDAKKRHLLYLGFHNFLTPVKTTVQPTPSYTFSPYLGARLHLGRKREVAIGLEVKWHRPTVATGNQAVRPIGLGGQGALAILGGITLNFPRIRTPAEASVPIEKSNPGKPSERSEP